MNDPYDIRVPVQVDYDVINRPGFYAKIEEGIKYRHPELPVNSRAFQIACANLRDLIRENPKRWFERNMEAIRESNIYDIVGVLSLTLDALSENMWAYYGNDNKGFCVGYDGVEIYKAHPCSCTYVQYRDEPFKHDLLKMNDTEEDMFSEFFSKRKKWEHEREYRFVTMFIKKEDDRRVRIPEIAIKEVILGKQISLEHEHAIINVLAEKYNSQVSLFKLKDNVSSYGLKKIRIAY